MPGQAVSRVGAESGEDSPEAPGAAAEDAGPPRPITGVRVPSIALEADVVPPHLVRRAGGLTWEVPAFKAGHGVQTAGAGQQGNAVLLGHVTTLRAGNVFEDLHKVQIGDVVEISSEPEQFNYRVTDVRSVPRTEVLVLEPTDVASVTLITCTGRWLPTIWDYTERLVVRAELFAPPS